MTPEWMLYGPSMGWSTHDTIDAIDLDRLGERIEAELPPGAPGRALLALSHVLVGEFGVTPFTTGDEAAKAIGDLALALAIIAIHHDVDFGSATLGRLRARREHP